MNTPQTGKFEFDGFRIDGPKRLLTGEYGEPLALTPKVFDLLYYLVENRGKVIGKDELMTAVWADTIVEESNLSQNISILRRTLGEKRGEHRFIATVPGNGYKFVADVAEVHDEAALTAASVPDPGTGPAPGAWNKRNRRWAYLAAVALFVLAVGLTVYLASGIRSKGAGETARTLAVLPFKPLVAEHRDAVLEMGMADTLISRLGGQRSMIVRPLSAVRKYDELDQDAQNAGRELGVESVLDGSIQRWGDKIRVSVRLIRVADGSLMWTGTFDEKFEDIFVVQDAISQKIADAFSLRASNPEVAGRETRNIDAYRLYLQGRYFAFKLTPPDIHKGIEFYQQAIDADPLYTFAYAGMAQAYATLPITSDVDPKEAFPKAKAAAQKALEINENLAEAHLVLGAVAFWFDWDWARAESELKTALDATPDSPDVHRMYSVFLTVVGRHDEAIAEMRTARELDPLSLVVNSLEGQALFLAGRDAEAVDRLNKTFAIEPNFWIAHIVLSRVYASQGRFDDAIAEAKRAREFSGGNSEALSMIGYLLGRSGHRDEAIAVLGELEAKASQQYVPAYNIALVHHGLGDTAKTLEHLEAAYTDRDARLMLLKVDPKWRDLRDLPRFKDLISRMKLDP